MQYKEFTELSNEEIRFIVDDLFHPEQIGQIRYDLGWKEYEVEITCQPIQDIPADVRHIRLCPNAIYADFTLTNEAYTEIQHKWQQYLLAKGCNLLLQDNPYLDNRKEQLKEILPKIESKDLQEFLQGKLAIRFSSEQEYQAFLTHLREYGIIPSNSELFQHYDDYWRYLYVDNVEMVSFSAYAHLRDLHNDPKIQRMISYVKLKVDMQREQCEKEYQLDYEPEDELELD